MSLSPRDVQLILEHTFPTDHSLWIARNLEQLEQAAADALTVVWVASTPCGRPLLLASEVIHARASLVAYMLGSTYRLRRAELQAVRP
jgi:hypothetical protein